jgi:hypothetical protein
MNKYIAVERGTSMGKQYEAPREYQIAMQLLDKWWVRVIETNEVNRCISVVCTSGSDFDDIRDKFPELILETWHKDESTITGVFTVK